MKTRVDNSAVEASSPQGFRFEGRAQTGEGRAGQGAATGHDHDHDHDFSQQVEIKTGTEEEMGGGGAFSTELSQEERFRSSTVISVTD